MKKSLIIVLIVIVIISIITSVLLIFKPQSSNNDSNIKLIPFVEENNIEILSADKVYSNPVNIYTVNEKKDKFSKADIKENLQKLYDSLNYTKKAKANDIEEYFEVKDCKVLNSETGKYEHGFELIKRKI